MNKTCCTHSLLVRFTLVLLTFCSLSYFSYSDPANQEFVQGEVVGEGSSGIQTASCCSPKVPQKPILCLLSSSIKQGAIFAYCLKNALLEWDLAIPFQVDSKKVFCSLLWKPLVSYQFHRLNVLSSQPHPPTHLFF